MDCYACGQRLSPEAPFPDISLHDEVSSILKTTEHLDELISSLNASRSKLLRRLNELRASTSVFPPEILSTIFRHASPPTNFNAFDFVEPDETDYAPESHGQITLGSVSSYWRQVVLSTSQLWTNTIIYVSPENAERKAQLIQLYLTNVGNMNLSLHISPGPRSFLIGSDFDLIFNSIRNGAHKFKLLSWINFPEGWILFPEDRFTHLEDLRLQWATTNGYSDTPDFQITSFPRLRHLHLWDTQLKIPSRPLCQSLAILHLVEIHLHVCIKILLLCPNLVEYSCHKPKVEVGAAIPQLSESMTFHHMKIFHAPHSTTASFASILRYLNIPVPETLGLELCPDTSGLEDLISFMIRLPVTWRILLINGDNYSKAVVERIFQRVPHQVRSLHLLNVHSKTLGSVFAVVQKFDDHHNPLIVGLQNININPSDRCFTPETNSPYSNLQAFLNMVSARKHYLKDGQFSLELGQDAGGDWEYYSERLEQIVPDGLRLNITMAGKTIYPPVG